MKRWAYNVGIIVMLELSSRTYVINSVLSLIINKKSNDMKESYTSSCYGNPGYKK